MSVNMRNLLGLQGPYWLINREERNYAALLYACLLVNGNLERFLGLIGCEYPVEEAEAGIYFEYALLRDMWSKSSHMTTDQRRDLITRSFGTADVRAMADASVLEWNEHFGVGTPSASAAVVQSPSKWSMKKFAPHIAGYEDFLNTCRYKWAFNIKPDLVIHTSANQAVVIEAKFESVEGSYPANPAEKQIFASRGLKHVGQTELQEYMFRHLLEIEAQYVFLVNKASETATFQGHRQLLWSQAFEALDTTWLPSFAQMWLKELPE